MRFDYCRVEDIIDKIGPRLKRPHRHEYYKIIWFTECSGSHMVEFANYDLQPNILFFFPINRIHSFLTTENIKGHMLRFLFLVMPKVDLRPLAELFRASVLKMLQKQGRIDATFIKMIMAWKA